MHLCDSHCTHHRPVSRRDFITTASLAALALKLSRYNRARVDGSWHETRQILRIVDRVAGLDAQALSAVAWSLGQADRSPLSLPAGVAEP